MSQGIKNIVALLVIAIVAAIGYFLFVQSDNSALSLDGYTEMSGQLLSKTQVFIERRQRLESLQLDLGIFTDNRFVSLQNFSTETPEQITGKTNIFNEAQPVPGVQ